MIKIKATALLLIVTILSIPLSAQSREHPNLIMTKSGVEKIRNNLGKVPLFDATLQRVKQEVDAEIAFGIDTPNPKRFFRWLYPSAS